MKFNEGDMADRTFKGRKDEYPPRRNVLILAGEAALRNGHGYAEAIGFPGNRLNLDEFEMAMEKRAALHWDFFTRYSKSLKNMDLSMPGDIARLREFCGKMGFDERRVNEFFDDLVYVTRNPPNVILDAEPEYLALSRIAGQLVGADYPLGSVHIAWILDNPSRLKEVFEISMSLTEPEYSDEGCPFGRSFDGDIWVLFRKTATSDEIEAVRIKEARKLLPDIETLVKICASR